MRLSYKAISPGINRLEMSVTDKNSGRTFHMIFTALGTRTIYDFLQKVLDMDGIIDSPNTDFVIEVKDDG